MHEPRCYGLFAPDELSSQDQQAVESLARQLTNFKSLSQLPSLKRSTTLSDGRIATAIDMGGVFRVLVSDKDALPDFVFDGLAHAHLPMWFSGVVENALPESNKGVALKLTQWTRRRLNGYKSKMPLPDENQMLLKFEIDYPKQLEHLKLDNSGIFHDTQYFRFRPSWHSGTMCEVVQAVAGFGRQDTDKLPENEIERATFALPDKVFQAIEREIKGFRLPAYSGFVAESGQFQYNYIARECDGVGFGADGMAWLIRMNASGVFAMPLPLIPATTTAAFRAWIEEVGDVEILHLLDRFGGMPSGETFPQGNDFSVWLRAGVIVKICDSGGFFDYAPMFEAGGFSFNSRGSEAFNTCFEYDKQGMMWVYGYKLRLKLAKCESRLGFLADDRDKWLHLKDGEREKINVYLAALFGVLDWSAVGLAIRHKIRRASVDELLARADLRNGAEAERDFWDSKEMKPIALHSGSLNRVTSGQFYANTVYVKAVDALKFPALNGRGCASFLHDMEYFIKNGGKPPKKCDTVVFGCFVNDVLRTVHYFYDERQFKQREVSDFTEPMIIGRWERTVTIGDSGIAGRFYTSDWDDRVEIAPTEMHEVVTGRDLGYGQPAYHTPPILYRVGSVSRSRYYSTTTQTHTVVGGGLNLAVCVPVYGRDAVFYAKQVFSERESWRETAVRGSMVDPTSYQMWTHDSAFHFMGTTKEGNKGDPQPKDGKPVYVDSELYAPYPYSDYADSGSWLGTVSDITAIVGQYTARGSHHVADGVVVGGEAPFFEDYDKQKSTRNGVRGGLNGVLPRVDVKLVHEKVPNQWFFDVSPVRNGADLSYFWRDCCVNFNGVEYVNVDEWRDEQQQKRVTWGKSRLVDDSRAHFFIGVVYE